MNHKQFQIFKRTNRKKKLWTVLVLHTKHITVPIIFFIIAYVPIVKEDYTRIYPHRKLNIYIKQVSRT